MANEEHLKILKQGVEVWNKWREENPDAKIDLAEARLERGLLSKVNFNKANLKGANLFEVYLIDANLKEADLSGANLIQAHLGGADFSKTKLTGASLLNADIFKAKFREANLRSAKLGGAELYGGVDLRGAKLHGASLYGATLIEADLREADLGEADLQYANLSEANLSKANLSEANLERSVLVQTKLNRANLTGCKIFGISAWELELKKTIQTNLIITPRDEAVITVDNIEVAQFIYLLLNNKKIRHVIDTITSKIVLILGRFTKPRKAVLDAIRDELRHRDYLPILFDFDKPASRDIHETVGTLARMARFVIADITNPRCIPQELVSIVEQLPSLPVQPLLKHGSKPWGMYDHIKRYPWVLEIHKYRNLKGLLASLRERAIVPAENKWNELNQKG